MAGVQKLYGVEVLWHVMLNTIAHWNMFVGRYARVLLMRCRLCFAFPKRYEREAGDTPVCCDGGKCFGHHVGRVSPPEA